MSSACGNCQVESQARACLCHSIYLQVVKVHLFNLGLPMNPYTFVLPSENQNAFRLLFICANAVYNVIQSLKDISSIKIFLQRYTRIFEIRRRALWVKKNDEIQKEHTSISLSLSLSTCRSIESTQSVVQKPMRTIKWVFSISQYV